MEEILMARDSVIFLLQHLRIIINFKNFILEPIQDIEFLVMVINSKTMALFLTQRKEQKMKNHCLKVFTAPIITLLDLTKLLGKLNFTIKAILPARLQF